ncbi:hypothetical protein NEIG_02620 [Nematocida sp. ERTm5]|nr:hypothetical protein NEIG_02620 [Nematocida sp. ERTm5]
MKEINNRLKKNNILITLILSLMIHSICARLETCDSWSIQKMKLGDKDSPVVIHPEGGLSPFYQCIMERSGYIKNLRGYLYAINGDGNQVGGYGSTIRKDSSEYMQAFTQQLINMFPSEDRYLSIESEKSDSFTRFLKEYKGKSDGLYVLASLFLLSEGINIPIRIVKSKENNKNKILVLKKKKVEEPEEEDSNGEPKAKRKKMEEGFHINLSMIIKDNEEENNTAEPVYQKKTEEIVNFFKNLVNTDPSYHLDVPEEFLMPTTHEEFLTGNFLCNPKFLIQSYIFEYINSVKIYKEFVRAVYDLLNEQISNNDDNVNPSMVPGNKAQEVFDSLFIRQDSAELSSKIEYIEHFRLVEYKLNNELQPMPYVKNAKPDTYNVYLSPINEFLSRHTPLYNRKKDEFQNDKIYKGDIAIEPAILCLFFLFTFDSNTGRYDISHMPNPSKELKRFFAKYSDPLQVMDYTMHREWYRVVGDLPNKNISYRSDLSGSRTPIEFGLLNMIYVIREIAAKNDTKINKKIESMKSIIDNCNKISDSNIGRVLMDIQEICTSLSKNKKIETQCGYFFTKELKNGLKDGICDSSPFQIIYKPKEKTPGSIVIELMGPYNDDPNRNGSIKYKVSENMLRNSDSDAKKTACDIQNMYIEPKSYIGYIMRQYTDLCLDKISYAIDDKYTFTKRIQSILNSRHTNPNGLLLCGNLETLYYKAEMIEMFLEKNKNSTESDIKAMSISNPMVQFTRNLVGSVPINEYSLKKEFRFIRVYAGKYKDWYPWVEQNVSTDTSDNNS